MYTEYTLLCTGILRAVAVAFGPERACAWVANQAGALTGTIYTRAISYVY